MPFLYSYSEFCTAAFRLVILAVPSRSNAQKLRRKLYVVRCIFNRNIANLQNIRYIISFHGSGCDCSWLNCKFWWVVPIRCWKKIGAAPLLLSSLWTVAFSWINLIAFEELSPELLWDGGQTLRGSYFAPDCWQALNPQYGELFGWIRWKSDSSPTLATCDTKQEWTRDVTKRVCKLTQMLEILLRNYCK